MEIKDRKLILQLISMFKQKYAIQDTAEIKDNLALRKLRKIKIVSRKCFVKNRPC